MNTPEKEKLHVGCSGWSYEDWVGPFYPKGTKPKDYLRNYSSVFDAVEIDSTFYRIPNQFMISLWKKNTPDGFLFSPKFPKKITHEKKLQNVSDTLDYFSKTLAGLGESSDRWSFSLPPSFKYDSGLKDLEKFIAELKTGFRYAVEFRHKSWFKPDVYQLLRSNNVAMCWSINQYVMDSPKELTSNFIYNRMVGEDRAITNFGETQRDTSKEMKQMSEAIKSSMGSVDDAFVFFNNHFAGFGPESVNEFRRLLGLMEMDFGRMGSASSGEPRQKSLADF